MKQLRIYDILKFVTWKEVWRSMQYMHNLSNKDKDWAKKAFLKINCLKPAKGRKDEYIQIHTHKDNRDSEWAKDIEKNGEQYYDISTNLYALSFRRWDKLINLKISKMTDKYFTDVEIIALFLWEITWYGDEKESLKKAKELFKNTKDVTGSIKNEK